MATGKFMSEVTVERYGVATTLHRHPNGYTVLSLYEVDKDNAIIAIYSPAEWNKIVAAMPAVEVVDKVTDKPDPDVVSRRARYVSDTPEATAKEIQEAYA